MPHDPGPPIAWSLPRRLRYFGGMAMVATAVVIGMELLRADITNGRAFTILSPFGVPLWSHLLRVAVTLPLVGVAVAILLPLYRHRFGPPVIGAVVTGFFMALVVLLRGGFRSTSSLLVWWQPIAAIPFVLAMGIGLAVFMKGSVMGDAEVEPDVGPRAT